MTRLRPAVTVLARHAGRGGGLKQDMLSPHPLLDLHPSGITACCRWPLVPGGRVHGDDRLVAVWLLLRRQAKASHADSCSRAATKGTPSQLPEGA